MFLKNYSLTSVHSLPIFLMELLLNLAWLLLAFPAIWLWRRSRSAEPGRGVNALQCLLALGCLLVILFPVVSATDDLRAMRSEMEESPASKRTIRQASNDRAAGWKRQSPPALVTAASPLSVGEPGWPPLPASALFVPAAPVIELAARAPPFSVVG
jgi:hypothetical protein